VSTSDVLEPRPQGKSIPVQVVRSIGWTVLLLLGLALAVWLFQTREHPVWGWIGVFVGLVIAAVVCRRYLRRWESQPRWFLPVSAVVLALALIPALKPFTISPNALPVSCTPLVDAWRPVVSKPSAADLATFRSVDSIPTSLNLRDPAVRRELIDQQDAARATPAFQRAERWAIWTFGQGPCVAHSQRELAIGSGVLAAGAAGIVTALSVRRRRERRMSRV